MRALLAPRSSLIISTAIRPAASRPTQAGTRHGVGAPTARAYGGQPVADRRGLVVDDVVRRRAAVLERRDRRAGGVVHMQNENTPFQRRRSAGAGGAGSAAHAPSLASAVPGPYS